MLYEVERSVPFSIWRGGTSRCVVVSASDVPPAGEARDSLLAHLLAGRHGDMIDGLGGNTVSTGKTFVLSHSNDESVDLSYEYGVLRSDGRTINHGGNCGNCLSAAGLQAARLGHGRVQGAEHVVRLQQLGSGQRFTTSIPLGPRGQARFADDGGVAVNVWFEAPGGGRTGELLPTGNPTDVLDVNGRGIPVSVIDAGAMIAVVRGNDLPTTTDDGLVGLVGEMIAQSAGFSHNGPIPPVEGVAVITQGEPSGTDPVAKSVASGELRFELGARYVAKKRIHGSYPITGAVATAVAVALPGGVAAASDDLPAGDSYDVVLAHPGGRMTLSVSLDPADRRRVARVGVHRTARLIAEGQAAPPTAR